MLVNEPVAALRTVSATLDVGGVLLSLATSWASGQVKVSRNGSTFVNAANLPVAVTGGGDGAFDLELALTEVGALGAIRVRFYTSLGVLIGEYADTIDAAPADFIEQDEPDASERTLEATIYALNGDLLSASTVWATGMVRVSEAGAAFVNAAALPVAVTGGGDGAFTLQLSIGEVSSEGNLRVRVYDDAIGTNLIGEFVAQVRAAAGAATAEGTSTAAAIRDRITAILSAATPTTDPRSVFRAFRNEGAANFTEWCEANPAGCLRRFQIRDDGTEEPPEVSNTDVDLRHVTYVLRVAYPQSGRFGKDGALDRDDVIDQDWGLIERLIGIYGRAQFFSSHDCTPLGATREVEIGIAAHQLVVRARFSYYRLVT